MTGQDRMPRGAEVENLAVTLMHRDLTRPKWWRTAWGRASLAVASLAIVSTAVAAVVLLPARPVDEGTVVRCLSDTQRNADGSLPGVGVSIADQEGVLPIDDAEAVCEEVWRTGALDDADPLDPTPTPGTVPSTFTTCVSAEGFAVVAPGRIECSTLGLHPHQP